MTSQWASHQTKKYLLMTFRCMPSTPVEDSANELHWIVKEIIMILRQGETT